MEPTDKQECVDPDYESSNSVLRSLLTKEKEDKRQAIEKRLYKVIEETFDTELALREKQLFDIEEKITKAQKLLHLIRYALVTSYYNKKKLILSASNEDDPKTMYDKQNRIHPAIKKLLGNNPAADVFNVQGKRKAAMKNSDNGEASTSQYPLSKKAKLELIDDKKANTFDSNQNCLQNRKRFKHRLVVGNISKYMPSLEDDQTTHKWMVYVRGDKTKPDISDIVEKVVFYLHPSYKPHDIVEVKSPPFHLARRGWGEFPLRVQIFFVCSFNKPIDIVHNLKLDKTLSGRQMLGNESIVDVYLHENSKNSHSGDDKVDSHQISSYFESKDVLSNQVSDQKFIIGQNLSHLDKDSSPSAYLNETVHHRHSIKSEYPHIDYTKPKVETIVKEELIVKEETEDLTFETDENIFDYDKTDVDMLPTVLLDSLNSSCDQSQSSENCLEHNYCQDEERCDIVNNNAITDLHDWDHSYAKLVGDVSRMEIEEHVTYTEEDENILKFGLGNYCQEDSPTKMNKKTVSQASHLPLTQPIKILPSNMNQLVLSNGQVIQLKMVEPQEPHIKLLIPSEVLTDQNSVLSSPKFTSKVNPHLPQTNFQELEQPQRDWYREIMCSNKDKSSVDKNDPLLKSLLIATSLQKPFDNSIFSERWSTIINRVGQELSDQSSTLVLSPSQKLPLDMCKKFRVYLPQDKFLNLGQALPFLFRRLPLWHSRAKVEGFRSVYPFMASSREEFESWNIGKRLSAEWSRAREVRKIISKENFPLQHNWTTKTYLVYARTHGYSPVRKRPLLTTAEGLENYSRICFLYNPSLPKPTNTEEMMNVDVNIDIESNEGGVKKQKSPISVMDPTTTHLCTFVREAARDCGIVLKPEEIVDGVMMNAAERMILEAVKCFADNLIRRAHFYLTCEKGYSENSKIGISTISKVMREREEMKAISEFQVGKRLREFYS